VGLQLILYHNPSLLFATLLGFLLGSAAPVAIFLSLLHRRCYVFSGALILRQSLIVAVTPLFLVIVQIFLLRYWVLLLLLWCPVFLIEL
jgi:hypothetical protein